ncbi:hypothetical protein JEQ12_000852 [Ovis aries]|uniref:Protein S100-A11 n=2 Tax=Ovis TaxID=9935 RepID=A0A836AE43_SHEEP|nr:hypothetical protein JEQ12_000852 [Ovis aries]
MCSPESLMCEVSQIPDAMCKALAVHPSWLNKMTHRLLRSIISIIDAFLSDAKSDGDGQRLNKTGLKKLLQEEFGNALEESNNSETIDKILQQLDQDGDQTIDFSELILLMFAVTTAYYAHIKPLLYPKVKERDRRSVTQEKQVTELEGKQLQKENFQERDQGGESQDVERHKVREQRPTPSDENTHGARDQTLESQDIGRHQERDQIPKPNDIGRDQVRQHSPDFQYNARQQSRERTPTPRAGGRHQGRNQNPEQSNSGTQTGEHKSSPRRNETQEVSDQTSEPRNERRYPKGELSKQVRGKKVQQTGELRPELQEDERQQMSPKISAPTDEERHSGRGLSSDIQTNGRQQIREQRPPLREDEILRVSDQTPIAQENGKYKVRIQIPVTHNDEQHQVRALNPEPRITERHHVRNQSSEPRSDDKQQAKVSSPTETERCIESLIAVFQKHAGRDGNNTKLSKAEFLIFMNTELGAFTKNQKDPGVLDRMMKKLDLNSDGQLDFQEFLNLIGGLAIACHESFVKSASGQK